VDKAAAQEAATRRPLSAQPTRASDLMGATPADREGLRTAPVCLRPRPLVPLFAPTPMSSRILQMATRKRPPAVDERGGCVGRDWSVREERYALQGLAAAICPRAKLVCPFS
jgi:hypothetical protein